MSPKSASLAATLVLVATIVTLLVRRSLLAAGSAGLAVQGLAVVLMLWARATFGLRSFHAGANPTAGGIVTSGPYAYFRHPIYAAILWFTWAGVLTHLSAVNAALGALATAATGVRIAAEERLLVERYPEYRDYAARVRRVIPFIL